MEHPFAITLDVGTSLINHTGSWRTLRPEYVHRLPPCNHACPAGEDIQGWLAYAESGDYEAAWRALTENNPLPAVMGRVCYHPCESACNRAVLDSAVGINSVERFLGDLAIKNDWRFAAPAAVTGQESAGGRRRTVGPVGGLSSGAARPCRDDPGSRSRAGRHDALRHSEISAAARCAGCRGQADRRARRRHQLQRQGRQYRGSHGGRRLRRGLSGGRCPHRQARLYSRPARRRRCWMRCRCCARWRARKSRCSAARSSSMAAAIPRSMSRAPPSGSARRKRSSSIAAPATACRPMISRSRRRSRRA